MYSRDLEIEKENNLYRLKFRGNLIKCLNSDNYVEHQNLETIEFIKDDLSKCGELKLNKQSYLCFQTIPCAYFLFSLNKIAFNRVFFDGYDLEEFLPKYFLFDFVLYNLHDAANYELKKPREALKYLIGEKDYDELLKYTWGRFMCTDCKSFEYKSFKTPIGTGDKFYSEEELEEIKLEWEGSDIEQYIEDGNYYITEKDFTKSTISKKLITLFNDCTEYEKTSILTLFHAFNRTSFLLPLLFISGWINKKNFINAMQFITKAQYFYSSKENIIQYSSIYDHRAEYSSINELSALCFNYANIGTYSNTGTKVQKEILDQIKNHETQTIEFKESLSLDVKKSYEEKPPFKKQDFIEKMVLKTIAGFLNAEGGTLFIGVKDNREITGIKRELEFLFYNSFDKMKQHLTNLINSNFGVGTPLVKFQVQEVLKKNIIIIKCSPSEKNIFLNKNFFVRKESTTQQIETPEDYQNYLDQKNL